jgi:MFS family permease
MSGLEDPPPGLTGLPEVTPPPPRFAAFRALRVRPFLLLWSGQTISRIGDFLYQITLAWWVLEETGSASLMGLVMVFSLTPMLLFLLVGGATVDRFPRVPLMLASDMGRALIALVVAGLAVTNLLEVWHVLAASLVFGFADAFFSPAYAALVPEITPDADLASANALSSMGVQAGRIVGPALGAAIIAGGGTSIAFGINAMSFLLAALFLVPLLPRSRAPRRHDGEQPTSFVAELREGIQFVRGLPILWVSVLLFAFSNVTLGGPFSVAMPFLVSEDMGEDVGTLGLLLAVFPIGYVLGGLWGGHQPRLRRRGLLAYAGSAVAGVMLATFGLTPPVAFLIVAALINGAALEIQGLAWISTVQEVVPSRMLGRVSSIDMMGSYALLPIGFGVAGWATERIGASAVFLIGGLTTAVVSVLLLVIRPEIRRFD